MNEFEGILKRDNGGLYLQSHDAAYRLILQRMPVDLIEKQVVVMGDLDAQAGDTIIAQGVRLDDAYSSKL